MPLEPAFVEALMDMVLETNIAIARRAVGADADVIILGDDYACNAGPMMSPELFDKMIRPRLIIAGGIDTLFIIHGCRTILR